MMILLGEKIHRGGGLTLTGRGLRQEGVELLD